MADKGQIAPMRSAKASSMKAMIVMGLVIAGLFVLPTMLVLVVGMLPTVVAYATDRRREKYAALCVGAMNFCGALPFVIDLWTKDYSFDGALAMISDPLVWLAMYGAAAVGWGLISITPSMVSVYVQARTEARIARLRQRQKDLIEEWGPSVAGSPDQPGERG